MENYGDYRTYPQNYSVQKNKEYSVNRDPSKSGKKEIKT